MSGESHSEPSSGWVVVRVIKDIEKKEITNGDRVTVYARNVRVTIEENITHEDAITASGSISDCDVNLSNGSVTGTTHKDVGRNSVTGKAVWRRSSVVYGSWKKLGSYDVEEQEGSWT